MSRSASDWIYSHGELEIPPGLFYRLNRPTRDSDFEGRGGGLGPDASPLGGRGCLDVPPTGYTATANSKLAPNMSTRTRARRADTSTPI
jgi:hypothetical protein